MRSDVSRALCVVLTSWCFMSCLLSISEGKCSGKWNIHACWGANGKRSSPPLADHRRPSLLQQLLLRDVPTPLLDDAPSVELTDDLSEEALARPYSKSSPDSEYSADDAALPPLQRLPSSSSSSSSRSTTLDRLTSLLRTLRTLQKENDELP